MQAILLAGGAGTRLRAVVSDVPKPMAPVAGRPFLSWLLDLLALRGITDVILSVGYLRQAIIETYGERYGQTSIRYAIEEQPLGTGGGLRNALAMVDRFPVFALNADTFLDLDYLAMHRAHEAKGAPLSIAVREVDDVGRYGSAIVRNGRITAFEAGSQGGPGQINAGVYLFGEDLLKTRPATAAFSFEKDFLAPSMAALQPMAFTANGYFIDIGVPEDYHRAQTELPQKLRELESAQSAL